MWRRPSILRNCIKLATLSLALPLLAAPALAQERPSNTAHASVEDCDWFRNAIIGTRCAYSYALGASVLFNRSTYSRATSSEITESESRVLRPSVSLSYTPTNWLTLSFASAHTFGEEDVKIDPVVASAPLSVTVAPPPVIIRRGPFTLVTTTRIFRRPTRRTELPLSSTSDKYSASFADTQTLTANLNLLDTGPSARNRFVVNAIVGDSILPAHDGTATENNLFGGITAHNQWYIGPSGTSLIGSVDLKLDRRSAPEDNLHAYTTASLLLSSDRLGLAFGPFYQGAFWLSSSEPRSSQTDVEWVGGKVVWQPFRNTKALLLDGLVLNASAMRTVGPANWVPADEADTRSLVLTGSAVWHFRF